MTGLIERGDLSPQSMQRPSLCTVKHGPRRVNQVSHHGFYALAGVPVWVRYLSAEEQDGTMGVMRSTVAEELCVEANNLHEDAQFQFLRMDLAKAQRVSQRLGEVSGIYFDPMFLVGEGSLRLMLWQLLYADTTELKTIVRGADMNTPDAPMIARSTAEVDDLLLKFSTLTKDEVEGYNNNNTEVKLTNGEAESTSHAPWQEAAEREVTIRRYVVKDS